MARALDHLHVVGVKTTAPARQELIANGEFSTRHITTRWPEETFLPEWEKDSVR